MNVSKLFDLHTHSTVSDGKLSPSALVSAAADKGIVGLALSDHDTIAGLVEAGEEAQKRGIILVHAVEIEINWNEFPLLSGDSGTSNEGGGAGKREFHLLGLGIDEPSPDFLVLLAELRESRDKRNQIMVERMRDLGFPCDLAEIYAISGTEFVGRPHFAEYLVQKKIVKNYETAFKKYFGKGEPLFVPRKGADFARALRVIKESGGIAVLAHPTTLYVSWGHMQSILEKLREAGLDGIEAWHPLVSEHESRRLVGMAEPLGLCITAGSDYHGEGRRDRRLGESSGGIKISADLFDFSPLKTSAYAFNGSLGKFVAALV
ncbi:MAG: PHP domain-containing protein [Spirochaetaceae bacterium]|nr:PHP domain-containing protein [Spirochaetaceae bacterium]